MDVGQVVNIEGEAREVSPSASFRDQWTRMAPEVALALPIHIPADRFMRVVLTAVNANPDLVAADRRSLFESAMKAAQDGLLPDGRDGALVIFKAKIKDEGGKERWIQKVQWMPMIGGILKKVRNSGDLLTISAQVAYEKDKFFYRLGDDETIEHEPFLDGERGKPRLVYAIAKTKDGGVYREVMTVAEVEKVRNVSRAKEGGPWSQWWGEMARKTVLRRLSKRLPMSSDLDDLIRRDDELYDFGKGDGDGQVTRMFSPVANPLADEPPKDEIQEQASPQGESAAAARDTAVQARESEPEQESGGIRAATGEASPGPSDASVEDVEGSGEDASEDEGPTPEQRAAMEAVTLLQNKAREKAKLGAKRFDLWLDQLTGPQRDIVNRIADELAATAHYVEVKDGVK